MSEESADYQAVSASWGWLRYLSGAEPGSWRWQHPTARRKLNAIEQVARTRLMALMDEVLQEPLTIHDTGQVRQVEVLRAIRYSINRGTCASTAALIMLDGTWEEFDHTSSDKIVVDTCLFRPRWRRHAAWSLRVALRHWLTARAARYAGAGDHAAAERVIGEVITGAWRGAHVEKTLRNRTSTKSLRRCIRAAMGVDPQVMAMARASRLCVKRHRVTQSWLTFVWRNMDVLARIRQQTPALLAPVAEYMFRHDVPHGLDPTRQFVKWLIANGIKRATFVLLGSRSARPFRSVIGRWHDGSALDSLVLALAHAQGPSGATPLRPAMYRATYDRFEGRTTPTRLRELLAPLPPTFFMLAQAAAGHCQTENELTNFLRVEYGLVLDWWLSRALNKPKPLAPTNSWTTWVRKASEQQQRQRAKVDATSWPCAVMGFSTPVAEVIALSTPLALFEESCTLRHCAYAYVDACKQGRVRLFSARLRHQGKAERGTIGLQLCDGQWRIWDIRGSCNRRLGGHWIVLARALAQAYNAPGPCHQLPLPLDTTRQDGVVLGDKVERATDPEAIRIGRRAVA